MQKQQKEMMDFMGEILRNSQRITEKISQRSDPPTINFDPYLCTLDYQENFKKKNDNRDLILRSSYVAIT
jgi:hypothetical protein